MTKESKAGSRLLIKGGKVVNDDAIISADVYIEDGVIKDVAPSIQTPPGTRIIDATGKFVMPGGIDPHTHFQFMFFGTHSVDDFETGTKAAVAGGTTMIIDFVMAYKNDLLLSMYEKYRSWADHNVCCDYGLSAVVSNVNPNIKCEMTELVKHKGINSFKFFLAYHGVLQVSDEDFYEGLVHCRKLGALARVLAENGDLIAVKEKELLALGVTGPEGHLQSHSEEPVAILGAVVFGEAVASALASIDGSNVYNRCWQHAAAHVVSPPLSTNRATGGRLLDALAAGQLHTTGSDHAVFNSSQKALGMNDFTKISNGVNGVEERMMIIWQKGVGRIASQSDADIVVWDPEATRIISARTHISKCDFNIFEGIECTGCPYVTICGGKVVYENGQISAAARGTGKFVALPPFAPLAFATVCQREKHRQPIKIDRSAPVAVSGNGVPTNLMTSMAPVTRTPSSTPSGVTSPSLSLIDGDMLNVVGGKLATRLHVTPPISTPADFHTRPTTRSGGRNLQDSSFTLSGAQIDDDQAARRSTKISKPPGGESRGLW